MTKKRKTPEERAQLWQDRFRTCEDNQRELFKRSAKYYDIMYAVQNTDKMAPWRSKVYVPILASKAWDLISRFSEIVPVFNVVVKNEVELDERNEEFMYSTDALERAEKIEHTMQEEYRSAPGEPMQLRTFDTLLDAVVTGSGFAKTPWTFEEKKMYAREFDEDGQIIDNSEDIVKTIQGGHNDFDPINFYNMFMPKDAKSFFKSPYWIVREYTTLDELEDTGLYQQSQLDKLRTDAAMSKEFSQYNASRNRLINNQSPQQDETVDSVVIYECYDRRGNMYVFGEGEGETGWVEIRKEKKMYWHGRPPIVPFYIRKKSFSPWGESLFENNARLQSAVNDLFNHYLDNWNLAVDQMLIYEDGSLVNDFIVMPGGEIRYKANAQKPEQFKFSEPNPNQLSTVLGVINQAIEAATVPQYLSGVPDSDLDQTQGTATGVKAITEAATEKVGFMRNNIKQSMRIVGQNWLSNLQQYQDSTMEVPIVKNGVRKPLMVTPGDLQGEIELDIDDDSMMPVSKQAKRENIMAYMAQMRGIQQAAIEQAQIFSTPQDIPRFNFTEMIEDVSDAFSVKDFTKYLMPNNIPNQPAAPGGAPMPAAPGMPGAAPADAVAQEAVQSTGV